MGLFDSWLKKLGLGGPQPVASPSKPTPPPAPAPPKPRKPASAVPGLTMSDAFDFHYGNLEAFAGKPVRNFAAPGDISDFNSVAPRVQVSWDSTEPLVAIVDRLLDQPGIEACEQLVIGAWNVEHDETPQAVIDTLVARKDRLPNLKAVFFGDITSEQNEMSWIQQGDYGAFWQAFPKLEAFHSRGAENLRLGPIRHDVLHTLVIQTGGMSSEIAADVLAADAPLRHLELWIGDESYGCTTGPDELRPLLEGRLFPELKQLGLCNAVEQDAIVAAVATSPLLGRLETLDISKGALTDKGGEALAASPQLSQLPRLVIAHHYMDMDTVAALKAIVPTVVQSKSDPLEPETYGDEVYYSIAVAE